MPRNPNDPIERLSWGNANWVENTDADVNDLVQFRTVITAQQGAKNYVLHDVMEKGFTFVGETVASAPAGTVADEYTNANGNAAYSGMYVYLVRETVESSPSARWRRSCGCTRTS